MKTIKEKNKLDTLISALIRNYMGIYVNINTIIISI